jgi:hypothetical protein
MSCSAQAFVAIMHCSLLVHAYISQQAEVFSTRAVKNWLSTDVNQWKVNTRLSGNGITL